MSVPYPSSESTELIIDNLNPEFGNLVLGFELGASVIISDPVTLEVVAIITVVEVRGGKYVKLGSRVPRNLSIDRDVIYLKKLAAKADREKS